MNQDPNVIDHDSIDKELPQTAPTTGAGFLPLLSQVYGANVISNWKLVFPSNLSSTATGKPIAVVRLSPLTIWNADYDTEPARKVGLTFSPVQFVEGTYNPASNFEIINYNHPILPQNPLLSHQYVSGGLNVSVRLTSNTGISGNIVYAVANNVMRNYTWKDSEKYPGYSCKTDIRMQSHTVKSFAINDVSLIRHSINPVPKVAHQKFMDVPWAFIRTWDDADGLNNYANFYTEDLLLIYALSDISGANTGPVVLDFIFDFSEVVYETPTLPTWFIDSQKYYYHAVKMGQFYKQAALAEPSRSPPPSVSEESTDEVDVGPPCMQALRKMALG